MIKSKKISFRTKEKLGIVMPAHNEEQRISPTLEAYGKYFSELKKKREIESEIIVVINACKDNTIGIVKKYEKKYKQIKHIEFEQGGKGFAIIEGFKYALEKNYDLIGFVDADMATGPEAFYDLVKTQINESDKIDGVIASRWVNGAKTERSAGKYIRSRGFNFLIRTLFLFNYKDTQCGAKLFKKEVVKKIIPEMHITKWAFDVNLLYLCKRNKFKIKEIPTVWNDKEGSHISSIKVPAQMAAGVIRLRILNSPFKDFIRIYDKMPEFMKIHHNIK